MNEIDHIIVEIHRLLDQQQVTLKGAVSQIEVAQYTNREKCIRELVERLEKKTVTKEGNNNPSG